MKHERMPRLTAKEIEAVLAVAGNGLAAETFADLDLTEAQQQHMVDAYERGMGKLRAMRAARSRRRSMGDEPEAGVD